MPKVGDERFMLEIIDSEAVIQMARENGYEGDGDGVREFCEPEMAADYRVFRNLDAAKQAAREYLATGKSFYGCAIIDREVFEKPTDDRGNLVRVPPGWERRETYEVAMDGELISVSRED